MNVSDTSSNTKLNAIDKGFLIMMLGIMLGLYSIVTLRHGTDWSLWGCDAQYYYAHLRSLIFDGDFDYQNEFLRLTPHPEHMHLRRVPETGRMDNKYGIGWAVASLPPYLIAHGMVNLRAAFCGGPAPTGYEAPYTLAVGMWQVILAWTGIAFLYVAGRRVVSSAASIVSIVSIFFGSPLVHYTVFYNFMAHAVGFFCVAALLYLAFEEWLSPHRGEVPIKLWFGLGLLSGLMFDVRFSNIAFAPVLLLPLATLCRHHTPGSMTRCFAVFALGAMPLVLFQMLYWHRVYGNWLAYSYGQESFHFQSPQIWNSLFSYQHGIGFYSPLSLLGMVGLIAAASTHVRRLIQTPAIVLLACALSLFYVNASWHCWHFADGFGNRAFIEALPAVFIGILVLLSAHGYLRKITYVCCLLGIVWTMTCWRLLLAGQIAPAGTPLVDIVRTLKGYVN